MLGNFIQMCKLSELGVGGWGVGGGGGEIPDLNTHFVPQTRISRFDHVVTSTRKQETLVLDQYFRFCVPSVGVTAPS